MTIPLHVYGAAIGQGTGGGEKMAHYSSSSANSNKYDSSVPTGSRGMPKKKFKTEGNVSDLITFYEMMNYANHLNPHDTGLRDDCYHKAYSSRRRTCSRNDVDQHHFYLTVGCSQTLQINGLHDHGNAVQRKTQNDVQSPSPPVDRSRFFKELARQAFPQVAQTMHDSVNHEEKIDENSYDSNDVEGDCIPSETPEVNPQQAVYPNQRHGPSSQENRELKRLISDLEMGDAADYLPNSASKLVSTLRSLSYNSREGPYLDISRKNSSVDLQSLTGIQESRDRDCEPGTGIFRIRKINSSDITFLEKEAEALLDSIRNADGDESLSTIKFDDDDSMIGDISRLSSSVSSLQRDLENIDFSFLDDECSSIGDVHFCDHDYKDKEKWSLLLLWFSGSRIFLEKLFNFRSSAIESKLYAYCRNGTRNHSSNAKIERPSMFWSLALIIALILLMSKFAGMSDCCEVKYIEMPADVGDNLFEENVPKGNRLEDVVQHLLNA